MKLYASQWVTSDEPFLKCTHVCLPYRSTLLHKLHEQSEQLTKLRELFVSMSKQGGAGMQKLPDNS